MLSLPSLWKKGTFAVFLLLHVYYIYVLDWCICNCSLHKLHDTHFVFLILTLGSADKSLWARLNAALASLDKSIRQMSKCK